MPFGRMLMLLGLSLPLAALVYGMQGGDGRVELALLAIGVLIFLVGRSMEKKRA